MITTATASGSAVIARRWRSSGSPMSRNGASSISSSHGIFRSRHSLPHPRRLLRVEREEDRLRVLEAERARVVHRAHRRGMRAGDEDPADRALRQRRVCAARRARDVRDDDAGLRQQPQLERELQCGDARGREQRAPAEELGHDRRVTNCDSPRGSAQRYSITASTRPSLVRQHLEVGADVRQLRGSARAAPGRCAGRAR